MRWRCTDCVATVRKDLESGGVRVLDSIQINLIHDALFQHLMQLVGPGICWLCTC